MGIFNLKKIFLKLCASAILAAILLTGMTSCSADNKNIREDEKVEKVEKTEKIEKTEKQPTMADYWEGTAYFKNYYNSTNPADIVSSAEIVPVNGVWYKFNRFYVNDDAYPGLEILGTNVCKSTDKGMSWSEPVPIIKPFGENAWSRYGNDSGAYWDGERWHILFQSMPLKPEGSPWCISYLVCDSEDAAVGEWYAPPGVTNPVIHNGDIWNTIAVGENNVTKISGGQKRIFDEGTPKILIEDDGKIYVTFHGASFTKGTIYGYRGIAETTDFITFTKAADDCIFSCLDALDWNVAWVDKKGSVGGGAAAYIKDGEYWYTLIESPDISLGCTDGQMWPFGLLRSKSLTDTKWENWTGNPMPELTPAGPSLAAWQYPTLFSDDGTTYLTITHTFREFKEYRLVWNDGGEKRFPVNELTIPTNSKDLDLPYIVENTAYANESLRFCDLDGYIIYKIDLNEFKNAVISLEILQNYIIEISGDGINFTETHNYKKIHPEHLTDGSNRTVITFDPAEYNCGDAFWFKISNTDTSTGWGGSIRNIYITYAN